MAKPTRFPGWRTMTGVQRRNAKMHAMFERAREQGHTGFRSMTICAREVKAGDVLEGYGLVDRVEVDDSNVQISYENNGGWGDFSPDARLVRMNPVVEETTPAPSRLFRGMPGTL